MSFGYTGNILHIDLTLKKHWIENPDEIFYRTYWGGRAVGLYYMLKEMKPGVDPFSPDNILVFAPSVIVSTPAPAIPRYAVCCKISSKRSTGRSRGRGLVGS